MAKLSSTGRPHLHSSQAASCKASCKAAWLPQSLKAVLHEGLPSRPVVPFTTVPMAATCNLVEPPTSHPSSPAQTEGTHTNEERTLPATAAGGHQPLCWQQSCRLQWAWSGHNNSWGRLPWGASSIQVHFAMLGEALISACFSVPQWVSATFVGFWSLVECCMSCAHGCNHPPTLPLLRTARLHPGPRGPLEAWLATASAATPVAKMSIAGSDCHHHMFISRNGLVQAAHLRGGGG